MKIESGTTWDRKFRVGLFFAMCVGMMLWFAYDGFYGYPHKNLTLARQKLPTHLRDQAEINPRATVKGLRQVEEDWSVEEIRNVLGEPTIVEKRHLVYIGPDMRAVIRLDDEGNVLAVETSELDDKQKIPNPNPKVTSARVERIKKGMAEDQVRRDGELGQPTEEVPETLWYLGPAAYAEYRVADGKVVVEPVVHVSEEHTEDDIRLQKIFAGGLAVLALVVGVWLIRIVRTRVELDESGLTFNGRLIPWDAMTGLVTDRWRDKGWVDLKYQRNGDERMIRLDSYHIDNFDSLLDAICETKGFPKPGARGKAAVSEPSPATSYEDAPDDEQEEGRD